MEYDKRIIQEYNNYVSQGGNQFKVLPMSKILIETTSHCNLDSCTFCAHKDMKRKREFMSQEIFEKAIKQSAKLGFKAVDLRFYGEPLLDKELEKKTIFARRNRFERVMINTNGLALDKKRFESLAKSGMNSISFSLSPKREFEATRDYSFDKLIKNLEDISKSEYKNMLQVWTVVTKNTTKAELHEFDKLIKGLGLHVNYTKEVEDYKDITKGKAPQKDNFGLNCFVLMASIFVLADGSVITCGVDYEGERPIGNLHNQTLKEILTSEKYLQIRKDHLEGKLMDICKMCSEPEESFVEIAMKSAQDVPLEYFLHNSQK